MTRDWFSLDRPARRVLGLLAGPDARIWSLTAGAALLATGLYASVVSSLGPPPGGDLVPWYVMAAAFVLTEVFVVHVHIRHQAQTVSLAEIAIVLGLFYATPTQLLVGQAVGVAAALALHRRQPLVKLAFNVAVFTFTTTLGIMVFRGVLALGGNPFGPAGWSAAVLALVVTELVAVALVMSAISLVQGRPTRREAFGAIVFGLAVTLANTSVGLFAVLVAHTKPAALWLLIVPLATVVIAYRSYSASWRRRRRLESLHDSFEELPATASPEAVVVAVLEHAHRVFGVEVAQLDVIGADGQVTRTTLHAGAAPHVVETRLGPSELTFLDDTRDRLSHLVSGTADQTPLAEALRLRGVGEGMVTALRGEAGQVTMLAVAAPVGDVDAFTEDDLVAFETFASHAVLALQTGRLTRSLVEVTELKEQLHHDAFHDSLTGLANRALLVDRIEHGLARRVRDLAVLFLDVDDFKTINDSLGHAAGDRVLMAVADRLRTCLRPRDTVARLGGDEFAILLEGVSDGTQAVLVSERIEAALQAPIFALGRELAVAASIGIVLADENTRSAGDLLRDADVAMYNAKEDGKSRYRFFEREMQEAVVHRHELKEDLQRAVERGEFELHYQPLVDLGRDDVVAVEALVRWRHPRRGLVFPGEFIGLAEETGLMLPIGRFVLAEACRQVARWHALFPSRRGLALSVNLSARQLRDPGFVAGVRSLLSETGLAPGSLILEITETVAMTDTPATIEKLEELSRCGVRLAIDDFGTGYSSLSYLQRFPFDILKIAKPFVDGLGEGAAEEAFAATMVKLAEALDLVVVAEGIEEQRQVSALVELGCRLGQGYHFSRPVDARAMENLLRGAPAALAG